MLRPKEGKNMHQLGESSHAHIFLINFVALGVIV